MPFDSSGNYGLPPGYLATTGQTILTSQHNPIFSDVASALSQTLLRSGAAPLSGNLSAAGFKITNAADGSAAGDYVNKGQLDAVSATIPAVGVKLDTLQPYVSVASAATTDIGALASQNVTITGTTTITSFGTVAAGTIRTVVFSGALILTHNATSLILPYGANITTIAGESLRAVSLGSGNWRVTEYQKSILPALTVGNGLSSTGSISAGTLAIELDLYTGTNVNNTNFPVGERITAYVGTNEARNSSVVPALNATDSSSFVTSGHPDAGASLSGTWRARGGTGSSQNEWYDLVRIA